MLPQKAPRPFGGRFRGKQFVIPGMNDWLKYFYKAKRGASGSVVMYATAPVGTEVWVRYEIFYNGQGHDTGRASWQCLARVTKSERLRRRLPGESKYRTTFVLIGDPERHQH